MGLVRLEIPVSSPNQPEGLFPAADPEPDWSFESLLSELNSLEKKINASSTTPVYLSKSRRPPRPRRGSERGKVAFVMSVSDDDTEEEEDDDEDDGGCLVAASRFCCDQLYISDDSESELELDDTPCFLEEEGLEDVALFERRHDHLLAVEEEMRDQISALEIELLTESDKSASAFDRIVKYMVARKEADKKLDVQYHRKIAEALDNHITAIQRDHEQKSQIEEKRIQNDAAEARREKALQEERLRQEKARAEAEEKARAEKARAEKARAEEAAKLAALAAAKEAEKKANELSKQLASAVSKEVANGQEGQSSSSDNNVQPQMRAAENALVAEQKRIQKLEKLEEENSSLIMKSNVDFSAHQRNISRLIRTMSGVQQNVIGKANEIIKIMMNPSCPQAISILAFAEKVVSNAQNPSSSPFASAHVIVLVASKVPQVLDFVLAKLHRACIYSVPKHVVYSESVFKSKEAYFKALGFQQQHDGNFESDKSFLDRLKSYMMLYGALVQMETSQGFQNPHGPKEGWAWLARFLNKLPANRYTVAALHAFLTTAGFVLFRKYKSQFLKLMNVVRNDFLPALSAQKDSTLSPIRAEIQAYIDDGQFRKEPEGRQLQAGLLSNVMLAQPDHSPNHYGYNRHY